MIIIHSSQKKSAISYSVKPGGKPASPLKLSEFLAIIIEKRKEYVVENIFDVILGWERMPSQCLINGTCNESGVFFNKKVPRFLVFFNTSIYESTLVPHNILEMK
jgi:hypothetical protein